MKQIIFSALKRKFFIKYQTYLVILIRLIIILNITFIIEYLNVLSYAKFIPKLKLLTLCKVRFVKCINTKGAISIKFPLPLN